jgi:hypothetical protein
MTEQRTYSDFDLMIEGTGEETYRARVLDSPAGGAAGSFALPFSTLELENFLLKVGRPRRGTRRLESPEMEAARQFGKQLFDAVFQDDLRLSLRRSLDEVERRDEGLRIRLWFSDAPELAALPWEFLYSESEDQFLVLSAWTPIVRYLDLTQRIDPLTVDGPLRILVMISSPHDYPTLDVEEEWRRIEDSLRPVIDRGAVTIDRSENATLLELQHKLRKNDYHIFHFLGHGGFDEKSDDGVLVMEDGHNRSRLVTGRDLGTILSDHRSLRLAVLNACEGARASDEDPFSGAAQSLIRRGIPAVVAMQFEITDDAAIAFAQEFYGAIADAYPVDAAIGEARRAIFGLGNDIEWGTPVVYLRGDGQLFEVQPAGAPADGAAVEFEEPAAAPEPPPPIEAGPDATDAIETVVADADEGPPITGAAAGFAVPGMTADGPSVEAPSDDQEPQGAIEEPVEDVATTVEATDGELTVADVELSPGSGDSPPPPVSPSLFERARALPGWAWGAIVLLPAILLAVLFTVSADESPTETTEAAGAVSSTAAPGASAQETATTGAPTRADDGTAVAFRTAEPKVIDGSGDDWAEPELHNTDHVIYVHPSIEDGSVDRAGSENASLIKLAWDETYLYVFAEVFDDVLSAPNTGNQIWRNDAVNLNISVVGADGSISGKPDGDDHQLTLSPGDPAAGTTEESVHFVGNGNAFSDNVTGFADVVAEHSPDGAYQLEARIPWSEIGVSDPQSGRQFGLILTVFDNDGEQQNGAWLQAEIKANTLGAVFQGPQTWGTLTLEG